MHYEPLTTEALGELPVEQIAADNCVLFLWTTGPFLASGEATDVARKWGFEPITLLYWQKLTVNGGNHGGGVGYWYRGNCEPVLVAKRGESHAWRWNQGWSAEDTNALFGAPKLGHSQKPDVLHERVERSGGTRKTRQNGVDKEVPYEGYPRPWLELFARRGRPGWYTTGNEGNGLTLRGDIRDALEQLTYAA